MRKSLFLQTLVLSSLLGSSCLAGMAKENCCSAKGCSLPLINRADLKAELDKVKLVDALDEKMFERSHVAGSVNIPMGEEKKLAKKLLPNKTDSIVVYCMNTGCHASDAVGSALTKLGYKHVSIYREGLMDLITSDFSLEGSNPKEPMPPKTASN
jgi:rhodanese-related sulfurtransferase